MVDGVPMSMLMMRSVPAYGPAPQIQAPAGEDGAAAPQSHYYGHGPLGMGRHGGFGPFGILGFGIGLVFRLLFFGLLLVLLLGLIRRFFWGPRHWRHAYPGGPPKGKKWKGTHHHPRGPWAWHHCGAPWES